MVSFRIFSRAALAAESANIASALAIARLALATGLNLLWIALNFLVMIFSLVRGLKAEQVLMRSVDRANLLAGRRPFRVQQTGCLVRFPKIARHPSGQP